MNAKNAAQPQVPVPGNPPRLALRIMARQKIVQNDCNKDAKTGIKPFGLRVMDFMLLNQPITVDGGEPPDVNVFHSRIMGQHALAFQEGPR